MTDSIGFSHDPSSSQCHCYQSSCLALDYNVMLDNAKSFYMRAEETCMQNSRPKTRTKFTSKISHSCYTIIYLFILVSPYCHTLIPTSRNWFDAREDCISRAMDLADIADEAEQTYIRNILIDEGMICPTGGTFVDNHSTLKLH